MVRDEKLIKSQQSNIKIEGEQLQKNLLFRMVGLQGIFKELRINIKGDLDYNSDPYLLLLTAGRCQETKQKKYLKNGVCCISLYKIHHSTFNITNGRVSTIKPKIFINVIKP